MNIQFALKVSPVFNKHSTISIYDQNTVVVTILLFICWYEQFKASAWLLRLLIGLSNRQFMTYTYTKIFTLLKHKKIQIYIFKNTRYNAINRNETYLKQKS